MSIKTFFSGIFSPTEKVRTNTNKTRPGQTQNDELSRSLSSQNMTVGDGFSHTGAVRGKRGPNMSRDAAIRAVRDEHNINDGDITAFRNNDLRDRIKIYLPRDKNNKIKKNPPISEWRAAARRYADECIRTKHYDALKNEIYMQMAIGRGSDPVADAIIDEFMLKLKSEDINFIAEDRILTASNRCATARNNQKLATAFAMRDDVDAKTCQGYQHINFTYMDDNGVEQSISDIRAEEKKYQALLAQSKNRELTPEEQKEFRVAKQLHDKYVVTGYAGGYTGLSQNNYVSDRRKYASQITQDIRAFGIQGEVLTAVSNFAEANRENGDLYNSITSFMNEVNDEYVQYANLGNARAGDTGEDSGGEETTESVTQQSGENQGNPSGSDQSTVTNPIAGNGGAPDVRSQNASHGTSGGGIDVTSSNPQSGGSGYGLTEGADAGGGNAQSTEPLSHELDEMIRKGNFAEFDNYRKENHISDDKACLMVLNNKNLTREMAEYGYNLYSRLNGDGKKLITFAALHAKGQNIVINRSSFNDLQLYAQSGALCSSYIKDNINNRMSDLRILQAQLDDPDGQDGQNLYELA